jgi:hypothetical protein
MTSRSDSTKPPGRPAGQRLKTWLDGRTYEVIMVSEYTHSKRVRASSEQEAIKFAVERERSRDRFRSRGYSLGDIHVVGVVSKDD